MEYTYSDLSEYTYKHLGNYTYDILNGDDPFNEIAEELRTTYLSMAKVNHRYRGAPELEKHNLMIQQTNHDLQQLYIQNGDLEYNSSGHKNQIKANIRRLICWKQLSYGESDIIYANLEDTSLIGNKDSERSFILLPIQSVEMTSTKDEIVGLQNNILSIEEELNAIYTNL